MLTCLMYRSDVSQVLHPLFGDELRLESVRTVDELTAAADRVSADLVFLDASALDQTLLQNAPLLRCDPNLCRAAFVFLGRREDLAPETECVLLRSGLDEVVFLPADGPVLKVRLENAIRRKRLLREVAHSRWHDYMGQRAATGKLLFACELDLFHRTMIDGRMTRLAEESFPALADPCNSMRFPEELIHPEDAQLVDGALRPEALFAALSHCERDTTKQIRYRVRDLYGRWIWVEQEVFYAPDPQTGCQCFSAVYLSAPMVSDAEVFQKALGSDVITVAVLDLEQDILKQVYVGLPVAAKGVPRSYRANYQRFFSGLLSPEDQKQASELFAPESILREMARNGSIHYQVQAQLPGKGPCQISAEVLPYDETQKLLLFVVRDVTRLFRQQLEQQQTMLAAAAIKEHLDTIMRINPQAMSTFRINLTADTLSDGTSVYPNLRNLQAKGTFSGYVEDALRNFSYAAEREAFRAKFSVGSLIAAYEDGHPRVSMRHHYMISDQEERILVTIVSMMKDQLSGDVEGIVYTLDQTREWYSEQINQMLLSCAGMGVVVVNVKKGTFIVPQESPILPFPEVYREQDFRAGVRSLVNLFVLPEERDRYLKNAELSNIVRQLDANGSYTFRSIWKRNGKRLVMQLSCYYLDPSHEQILGVAEDVTEVTQRERDQVEKYRRALFQAEQATQDKNLLTAAARAMFPVCIAVNLTQNTYSIIEYDLQGVRHPPESGSLDKLLELDLSSLPDGERDLYAGVFSRSSLLAAHARGERTVSLIHGQLRADGTLHRIRTTVIFANGQSNDDILEITVADCLDEQVKTEELLKKQETELKAALAAAEQANHAKSDFLSSMSHDIRTPLNAILNLASLLHEELNDPQKLEQDVQKIEVAGEFLLQLINDILDVSKIESGKLTLSPRVYTYATFLNYIKGIIVPLCEEKDVKFILDEGPTALDVYMDRIRFHQIFFNILSNAVKYTPPGGTVTFRTANNVVHDGILTCDFIVSDTGCGMSREFLARAFDPFEREDSQNAYVGTGLGLTICKRLVDLMGGSISIESELGRGTTVTVHMDLLIATAEQRAESQAEMDSTYHRSSFPASAEECRLLVVEDNAINREILIRLLEKKSYVVETAKNGREAVDLIRKHPADYYQLVLMDVRMPVMDGLEATSLIRQEPDEAKRSIPIIAITANAFESDVQECLDAGMNSHLSKPVSANALYSMVATYIHID